MKAVYYPFNHEMYVLSTASILKYPVHICGIVKYMMFFVSVLL